MRAYLITLLQLLFNIFTSFSQNVSGYILDFQSNPIENAVINVVGGDCHAHTDEKGYFSLNIISFPATITFPHLNYKLDNLTLDSVKVFRLTMEEKPIL